MPAALAKQADEASLSELEVEAIEMFINFLRLSVCPNRLARFTDCFLLTPLLAHGRDYGTLGSESRRGQPRIEAPAFLRGRPCCLRARRPARSLCGRFGAEPIRHGLHQRGTATAHGDRAVNASSAWKSRWPNCHPKSDAPPRSALNASSTGWTKAKRFSPAHPLYEALS